MPGSRVTPRRLALLGVLMGLLLVPAAALATTHPDRVHPRLHASRHVTHGRRAVRHVTHRRRVVRHRHPRRFPVPSCRWVTAPTVGSAFGLRVRALRPRWTIEIAPVLTCAFVERKADLQKAGAPIVTVQFRELQHFRPGRGWTVVKHLGSCIKRSSCPAPGRPAYEQIAHRTGGVPPYTAQYVAGVSLRVEDGLNMIVITVLNPNGPLSSRNEPLAAQRLARRLLPRFLWR